jgi:subtilisin family serine protease
MVNLILMVAYILFFLLCFCGLPLLVILLIYLLLAYLNHWWPFRPQQPYPPSEHYVQNQVILVGPAAVVADAIAQVRGVSLELLEPPLTFSELGPQVQSCPDIPPDLVVHLYRIRGLFPNVEKAVRLLNQTPAGSNGALAEPNWLSGHPWEPLGSPWEPLGSPWEPLGSRLNNSQNAPRQVEKDANAAWFLPQWAFDQINLTGRPEQLAGQGTLVGIFDTSPFPLAAGTQLASPPLNWIDQPLPMALQVSHPFFAATFKSSLKKLPDVRNHGLFIAGLVHALAPQASLQLVRVLDNDNRGDLFTLMREIFKFLKASTGIGSSWQGVAINLSLGIRIPPVEAGFKLPAELRALVYLMRAAHCLNVVVVAAAGNESTPSKVLPANMPAMMENVIGVAASNNDFERSCFANLGDLSAPGGDGGQAKANEKLDVKDRDCVPRAQDCDDPDCGFGVIGPALEPRPHTGYIFWTGSSFSTPMVSGLAALVQQAGGGNYTPDQVAEILYCGAVNPKQLNDLGKGVIDVARTLTECLRQYPAQQQNGALQDQVPPKADPSQESGQAG